MFRYVVCRRRDHHHNRKCLVVSILLTIAVGLQLVTIGRYTISYMFVLNRLNASVSATAGRSARRSYTADSAASCVTPRVGNSTSDDCRTGFLYDLTDDALAAETALRLVGNRKCFVEGLDEKTDIQVTEDGCPCKKDWFGVACSVPGFINRSLTPWSHDSLRVRSQPRRIVHAFPFSIEFDMLELRFAELANVVDVFVVLESNYTAYGTPKPVYLLDRLRNGTYSNVAGKVVHVLLNYFPREAYRDGWVADALHRNHLGTHGLRRLGGLRTDDLLVLTDADELPRSQLLSFLKWHDGYSEPVIITYQWSVYGFFWGVPAFNGVMKTHLIPSVVTVGMAMYVFRYQIYGIRSAQSFISHHAFDIQVIDLYQYSRSNYKYKCEYQHLASSTSTSTSVWLQVQVLGFKYKYQVQQVYQVIPITAVVAVAAVVVALVFAHLPKQYLSCQPFFSPSPLSASITPPLFHWHQNI